jgi:RHS repeat-associated protein
MHYHSNGAIETKKYGVDGIQSYTYDFTSHPAHAVKEIEPLFEVNPVPNQEITYTPFQKIKQIREGDVLFTTDYTSLTYNYGIDNERRKMSQETYTAGSLVNTKTKYYSYNFEKEIIFNGTTTTTREINYIFAPDGLIAIYENKNGLGKMYYTATDNLGSINLIVDGTTGDIVDDISYDAWGRFRNPYDWTYDNITLSSITDRGYTGHEHLQQFGLINMNGRMYDPLLARMLSPDPFVTNPALSQDYNRYSYVRNNPLKFTDPSGYFVSGGWGYYDRNLSSYTKRLHEGRDSWNSQLDKEYKRGSFGYLNSPLEALYAYFGSSGGGCANSNLPASVQFDMAMATAAKLTGLPFEKKDGIWGYYQKFWYADGEQTTIRGDDGFIHTINTRTFNTGLRFVSFSQENSQSYVNSSDLSNNSISGSRYKEALASTLLLSSATIEFPPAAIATLATGLIVTGYLYFTEAKLPPIPKYTYTYRPPSEDPINIQFNNNNYNPDWKKIAYWATGIGLSSWLVKNIYETHQMSNIPVCPQDNTYVVQPPIYPLNP